MNSILLISNNELINKIYTLNFKLYCDTEIKVVKSYQEAINTLNSNERFNSIISLSTINGEDVAFNLLKLLRTNGIDILFFSLGKNKVLDNFDDIHCFENTTDVAKVIKSYSKAINITAKEMANKDVGKFYPFSIDILKNMEKAICNIYYNSGKKNYASSYVEVFAKGDDMQDIDKFKKNNIQKLYVSSNDRLSVINEITEKTINIIKQSSKKEDKLKASEKAFNLFAESITKDEEISKEILEISNVCINTIKESLPYFTKVKVLLKSLIDNQAGHVYTHTILTSKVASHILENISWGSKEHIAKVSFILFFHDLLLIPIYLKHPDADNEEDLLFSDKLNEKEKEIILKHAQLSANIIRCYSHAPIGSDIICLQHHGSTNGVGFVAEFPDDISPLAKVIIISEEFVRHIIYQYKKNDINYDVKEIRRKMYEKFSNRSYHKLIDSLSNINI